MAALTVRNLPDEVHRALRLRASQHGRSTEAEVRAILESAVKPRGRAKAGTLMTEIGRKAGLTNADVLALEQAMDEVRDNTPAEPVKFE